LNGVTTGERTPEIRLFVFTLWAPCQRGVVDGAYATTAPAPLSPRPPKVDWVDTRRDTTAMMRRGRIVTCVVLACWILLGPVGMALSGCMMMDGCDALCSLPATAPVAGAGLSSPVAAADLALTGSASVPQNVWAVLDSPPKAAPVLL